MRSGFAGTLALTALLMPTGANAAMQVNCVWEGRTPVAITVEGDGAFWRDYDLGAYYEIEVNKVGTWLLLDEPRPVLAIQVSEADKPIGVALAIRSNGGRCWK
jgi:hypothetical protein